MNDANGIKIPQLPSWLCQQKPAGGLNDLC
jgi:hypothetical protein